MASELAGERAARSIQLGLEYAPAPPFASSHPNVAEPAMAAEIKRRLRDRFTRDVETFACTLAPRPIARDTTSPAD